MTLALVPQNPTLGGGPLGWLNCYAACGAMGVRIETNGAKRPTAAEFRHECFEPSGHRDVTGGLSPSQVVVAAMRFGVILDLSVMPFEDAYRLGQRADTAVIYQINYAVVSGTRFDGSPGFRGLHGIVQHAGREYDPLADGRKPGIPNGPQDWPKTLLRNAAGKVPGAGVGRALVIVARAPAVKPTKYSVAFEPGAIWVYDRDGGRRRDEFAKRTSAPCSAPFTIAVPGGRKRVVEVTAGRLKGGLVEPGAVHVRLVSK